MWEWRFANRSEDSKDSPMHAIRENEFVLLKNPEDNRVELYDIKKDYSQLNNVADRYPDKVESLGKQLDAWTESLR
jgi:hypothetical protein